MRIIAGRHRGRRLVAPKGLVTRPTMDRAREAIFQILGDLSGLHALDLYAGTGAMGLEALSRGATAVTFVETDGPALAALRRNVEAMGAAAAVKVVTVPVERAGQVLRRGAPYDLVLSDPPWPLSTASAPLVARLVRGLLAPGARVLLGHSADAPVELPPGSGLELIDRRRWGGTGMSFFEAEGEGEAAAATEAEAEGAADGGTAAEGD